MKKLLLFFATVLIVFSPVHFAFAALADNIVSYWKFDASDSTDALGVNNGTDTSITYSSGNGKINVGAGFNGTSSKITSAGTSFPLLASNRTINAWFNSATLPSNANQTIFSYGLPVMNQGMILLIADSGGTKYASFAGYSNDLTVAQAMSASTWYMITGTFDGTTARLYFNGTEIGNANKSTWATVTGRPSIGNTMQDQGDFFNGAIDEVGIWSRTLSATEVTELYNGGAGFQYPFTVASAAIPILSLVRGFWIF